MQSAKESNECWGGKGPMSDIKGSEFEVKNLLLSFILYPLAHFAFSPLPFRLFLFSLAVVTTFPVVGHYPKESRKSVWQKLITKL